MKSALIALGMVGLAGCYSGPTAFAEDHCTDQEFWKCTRDNHAGRIDEAELNECLIAIEPTCDGATWPAGCAPTVDQSQACILLLRNADLAYLTWEQLNAMYSECRLCE